MFSVRKNKYLSRALENVQFQLWTTGNSFRRSILELRNLRQPPNPALKAEAGLTRESWEKLFALLWEPVYARFSKDMSYVNLEGPQTSLYGRRSDGYEGFARTFIGAAYYLHHRKDTHLQLRDGSSVDLAAVYREGIINGTNPQHKAYWGKIHNPQRLVENCAIAIGLLLTRQQIWDRLSTQQKENIAGWFEQNLKEKFYMNNWQWFKVFHYIFLEKMGFEIERSGLETTLDNIDRLYVKDGWYSDSTGKNKFFDYYNAWAMHYYGLLFDYLADAQYQERKTIYRGRAREFFSHYRYFFTPGGHPPQFGRSQLYRWASLAPWGIGVLSQSCEVDYDWLKTVAKDTVNTFLRNGALRRDGTLSLGYYKEFTPVLESYSGSGSPYWAFKAFSCLMIPENHPFWNTSVKPVTPEKTIHAIPSTSMLLLHSGDGQVVLLSAGTLKETSAEYNLKYNKLAYSNRFLPNFDRNEPVDNMLLVKSESRWYFRRNILESHGEMNCCESRWSPEEMPEVIIRTILIGIPEGYIAIHELQKGENLRYYTGGFPICVKEPVGKLISRDKIILYSPEKESGMQLLAGQGKPALKSTSGVNPAGKRAEVPCFKGQLRQTGDILIVSVWAGKRGNSMMLPVICREQHQIHLQWTDLEPISITLER